MLSLLAIATAPAPARAALITQTHSGTFQYIAPPSSSGPDALGLDGASFVWTGTFDTTALRTFTNNVNLDRFSGNISLFLSGTTGGLNDGAHAPTAPTVGESTSGANDFIQLSNAGDFLIGVQRLNIGPLTVPLGFTGAVSPANTFTPFTSADISSYGQWDTDVDFSFPSIMARYSILNPQASFAPAPEPASLGLLTLAATARLLARQKRRTNS